MRRIILGTIVLLIILAPLLVIPFEVHASASSQSDWEGAFPAVSASLNQTLLSTSHDDYAEVSLSANLDSFEVNSPGTGQYQFNMAVSAAANTRRKSDYTISRQSGWDITIYNPHTITLGPNSGCWLDLMSIFAHAFVIGYYGATYRKVFITSNGFLVLDPRATNDGGGKWTSPTPTSIPSPNAPPCVIAPLWRHLDISRGGQIIYGDGSIIDANELVVEWKNVPNSDNGIPQTFAVCIGNGLPFVEDPRCVIYDSGISFIYKAISNDIPATTIGIQDQTCNRGKSITSAAPSPGESIYFSPNFPDNCEYINYVKISASKTKTGGSNNDKAMISIYGIPGTSGDPYYPGGVNVDQMSSEQHDYNSYQPAWSAVKMVIDGLSLVEKLGKFLGPVGFVIDMAEFFNDLYPAPKSEVQIADYSHSTAFVKMVGINADVPGHLSWGPHDEAVFATFVFVTNDPNFFQQIDFSVEVGYEDTNYNTHTLTLLQPIHIALNPNVFDWYGRTNPDGGTYNFNQYFSASNEHVCDIYAMSLTDSSASSYTIMGWNRTDMVPSTGDYIVRPDGTIRVEGDFEQIDNLPSSLWGSFRSAYVYVMYSDNLNKVVAWKQILGPNDGTNWIHRAITVGALNAGKTVKIGVGRTVGWMGSTSYNLEVQWKNIQVYDNHNGYILDLYGSPGGTTIPNPGKIGPIGIRSPPNTYSVTAYPNAGNILDYWILDGTTTITGTGNNPYSVTMNADHTLQPVFAPALSVIVSPSSVTMDVGQSQTFTTSVTGGVSPYGYKWYLNGLGVSGATSSSWTFTPSSTGSNSIYVKTTDAGGIIVSSNTARVTVNAAITVIVSPSSITMDVGQSQVFASTASGGTPPYTYRWGYSTDSFLALVNAAHSQPTGPSWTFTPSASGFYYVASLVQDSATCTQYSESTVTVNAAPIVTISPSSVYMYNGYSQTFTSTVSSDILPYTYQWYLNGGAVSGATSTTWTFTPSSTGSYTVYLKVKDSVGNVGTSNTATVTVTTPGGGGGGCPYVYDWNGTSFAKDNNILPVSETGNGTDTKDYYKLEQPLVPVFTTPQACWYSLQIREFENEIDHIDQIKLIAVDHSQGTNIAVTPEGEVLTYATPTSPLSCIDNHDIDRLSEITTMNGNVNDASTYFQGYKGDWLVLNFGKVTGSYAKLILRDDQKCCDVCINVQVLDSSGNWQTVEVLHPRDFWGMEAVNMAAYVPKTGDFKVRLFWTATHRLDYVGLDTSPLAPVKATTALPALAIHSTKGPVTQKLLYDDENCVKLVNGQQVTLWFTLPSAAQETTRDFILYTDGYYYTITP